MAWCSPPPGLKAWLTSAGQDAVDRVDRAAGDRRRHFVHAIERRAVTGPDAAVRRQERIVREAAHGTDVFRRVETRELIVRGDAWLHEVIRPNGAHQVDRRSEPSRRQRVLVAEVVAQADVAVYDQRPCVCRHSEAGSQPPASIASRHASAGGRPESSIAA